MRIQHGTDLWNKIDVQKFDRYFNSIVSSTEKVWTNSTYSESIGRGNNFNRFLSIEQLDIMSSFWREITGSSDESAFREEESWNSGNDFNRSTVVTSKQFVEMSSSLLLEVQVLSKNEDGTLTVRYKHPDVFFDLSKLYKNYAISSSVYSNISSYPIEELKRNKALTRSLNVILIRELVSQAVGSIRSKDMKMKEVAKFFQNLDRIQPFKSENYLTRKYVLPPFLSSWKKTCLILF